MPKVYKHLCVFYVLEVILACLVVYMEDKLFF